MTPLKKGDKAPDFEACDQDGNLHKLSDYKGSKLVMFFYPRASTPTCTVEACNLRDNYSELLANGFKVLGISADTQKKQANFHQKHALPFPLLADADRKVVTAYGVWGEKKFMGRLFDGIRRTTFVIDEDGIIDDVITDVKSKVHASQILK